MPIPLGPAEIVTLTGTDALPFAHAQFTSDVRALAVGRWQWSAWLDAQGRVRHFFALLHTAPATLIAWLPLGGAPAMRDALARFVLRAKVDIQTQTCALSARHDAEPPAPDTLLAQDGGWAFAQPGPNLRIVAITPCTALHDERNSPPLPPFPPRGLRATRRPLPQGERGRESALARWRLDDIAAGLPLLAPELAGEFVPQALDLERFDAIRFDKGCYPGQEIAARLHFRGGNKQHIQRLRILGDPPASGSAILDAQGRAQGHVLYSCACREGISAALAVLMAAQTANPLFTASGVRVECVSAMPE
jgi:folate-binding protein YgfZ